MAMLLTTQPGSAEACCSSGSRPRRRSRADFCGADGACCGRRCTALEDAKAAAEAREQASDADSTIMAPSWLRLPRFINKRAKRASLGEEASTPNSSSSSDEDDRLSPRGGKRHAAASCQQRASIELWHAARVSRTSIDLACPTTTTEKLSVCKAGPTTFINKTYIVVKHLGSGTYGQVKLAVNVRNKKLYAIKACRKSQLSPPGAAGHHGARGHMVHSLRASRLRRAASLCHSQGATQPLPLRPSLSSDGCTGLTPSSSAPSTVTNTAAAMPPVPARGPAMAPAVAAHAKASLCVNLKAEEFVREIAIMKKLSHKNIVQLVEVIDDPASDNLLLVMEYVEGQSLLPPQLRRGVWQALPEEQVWVYVRDVLQGLDYLHYHQVVHGDLKPANMILDVNTGHVKIVDFGSAVLNTDRHHGRGHHSGHHGGHHSHTASSAASMSCTPAFRAPESLSSGYRPSYELDMWGLGVCVYMWMYGELPFKGDSPGVVYDNIRSQSLSLPHSTQLSHELTDFISRLLDKDPIQRMTVAEAMMHPWVTSHMQFPLPLHHRLSMGCTDLPMHHSQSEQHVRVARGGEEDSCCSGGSVTPPIFGCSTSGSDSEGSGVMPGSGRASAGGAGGMGRCTLAGHSRIRRQLTQEDMDGAISSVDSETMSLMEVLFEEVHIPAGEVMIRVGDVVDCIFLLTRGEVEIFHEVGTQHSVAPDVPIITGLVWDPMQAAEEDDIADFLVPYRYSNNGTAGLYGSNGAPKLERQGSGAAMMVVDSAAPGTSPGLPQQQQRHVQEFQQPSLERPHGAATVAASPDTSAHKAAAPSAALPTAAVAAGRSSNVVVVAIKGPGDSLGLTSIHPLQPGQQLPVWQACVRARTAVSAFRARCDQVAALAARHPQTASMLQEMCGQQETDLAVAEAMRKLRLMGELAVPRPQVVATLPGTA